MWKYVLKVALRQKPRFFFFILMLFMSFSVSSISPYFNGIFIDMLCRPTSSRDVVALSLVIAGLGIVGAALSYFASMITSKLMTKTSMDLLRDEIGNLQISELLFIEKQNPAYLTQRLSQDVNSVSSFVLSNFMTVILNLARIALILFFLLYTSWFLGIFALILCGLYLLVFLLLKKPLYASLSQKKEAEAKMYGFMTTQVRNSFIIQLNSQYQQAQSELNHVFRISFPYILRAYKCSYLFSSADSIISVVFQSVLFIYAGVQIVNGNISVGDFIAANLYFSLLIKTLKYYVNFYKQYQDARASYRRLSEIGSYPKIRLGGRKITDINSISLNGTSFRFPNSQHDLYQGLKYDFLKGCSYSLIGDNGSGKSTLLKIISNLYPVEDTVLFDSVPVSEIDMNEARKAHMICVPQVLHGTEETVGHYICGLLNNDIDGVLIMLKNAQFLRSYANFISSALDKQCNTLSGGELRKLNIWIAVNRAASVLIFDEPTTGLDLRSKDEFIEYISKNPRKLLIIVMSHDEEVLAATNKTIKLENGVFADDNKLSKD